MWRFSCWMGLFQDVTWLIDICNVIFAIQNASFNIFWCWMSLIPDVTWLYGHTCVRDTSRVGYDMSHCNTLQHTATHCNTLQHTAIRVRDTSRVGYDMSHLWMSFVTHLNESCCIFEWVLSRVWTSHITNMTESYEWVTAHVEWVMYHIWMSQHIWMSHSTHMNASWHTCEWVTSLIDLVWEKHGTHWVSHVTPGHASCHRNVCDSSE